MAPLLDPPIRNYELDSICTAITPRITCVGCNANVELPQFGRYHRQMCVLPYCKDRFCSPRAETAWEHEENHLRAVHGAIDWWAGSDDADGDNTVLAEMRYDPPLRLPWKKGVSYTCPDESVLPRTCVEMLHPLLVKQACGSCILLLLAVDGGHLWVSATVLSDPQQIGGSQLHITQQRLRVEMYDGSVQGYDDVDRRTVHSIWIPVRTRYQSCRFFYFRDWGAADDWMASASIKRMYSVGK